MCINKKTAADELKGILPSRADFALVYRKIKSCAELTTSLPKLWCEFGGNISCGKIKVILRALSELKLISCEQIEDTLKIKALEYSGKADLSSAPIMKRLQGEINKR